VNGLYQVAWRWIVEPEDVTGPMAHWIWRRLRDSVGVIVDVSYKGRWQRVGEIVKSSNEINCRVYPNVSSLQDLRTVKVTYVSFVYVFPPLQPFLLLHTINWNVSSQSNTFNSARWNETNKWERATPWRMTPHLPFLIRSINFFLRDEIRPFNKRSRSFEHPLVLHNI
jgi:hypothetical protein